MRHLLRSIIFASIVGIASLASAQSSEQVNTLSVQTLVNKTFTAPIINGGSITGSIAGSATYATPILTSPTFNGAILGSASWDSPGSIGNLTPATGKFSTLTATTALIQGTCQFLSGTGSPETVVTAPVCSEYHRTDGSSGTTFYVKETGVGNTGWSAVAPSSVTWSAPGTIGSGTPNTGAFTTLSVTGQFTSTLATGTAPLVITSTTKATNLNADLVDGADWAAPLAIGTTTPAAGTFTTVTGTTSLVQGTCKYLSGAGSPEGVATAPVCSVYLRTDGASGTTIYTKEVGVGNTGWNTIGSSSVNWAVPGAIGSTTPNTGVFTAVTATRRISPGVSDTYGATIAIDSATDFHIIAATNSTDFTISNPTNALTGAWLTVQVENRSGGVLGTVTWDTLYKMASFTKPKNGTNRSATFRYNGTNWVEINCSPEVPNG